jgi:DNA-binding PadR family transcriptional regulator
VAPTDRLPLNPRDYLIMLVLAREPAHGYAIIKRAESISGAEVRLDPANLYRALRRLDRDGLVRVAEDAGSGEARRRTYALTAVGREVVTAETTRLARLTDTARAWSLIPGQEARS